MRRWRDSELPDRHMTSEDSIVVFSSPKPFRFSLLLVRGALALENEETVDYSPRYMISGTRENPPPETTLAGVYM